MKNLSSPDPGVTLPSSKSVPSQPVRGRLFKRIFTKAVSPSELCLDEPQSCYLPSSSWIFESSSRSWESALSPFVSTGSACRQLEAHALGRSMKLFCIYPVRWLGGSCFGNFGLKRRFENRRKKFVERTTSDKWTITLLCNVFVCLLNGRLIIERVEQFIYIRFISR